MLPPNVEPRMLLLTRLRVGGKSSSACSRAALDSADCGGGIRVPRTSTSGLRRRRPNAGTSPPAAWPSRVPGVTAAAAAKSATGRTDDMGICSRPESGCGRGRALKPGANAKVLGCCCCCWERTRASIAPAWAAAVASWEAVAGAAPGRGAISPPSNGLGSRSSVAGRWRDTVTRARLDNTACDDAPRPPFKRPALPATAMAPSWGSGRGKTGRCGESPSTNV